MGVLAIGLLCLTACIAWLGWPNFVLPPQPKKWAVLVAGSNTYTNYRHQADICHAYQIFRENGFPDDNIIVMMYDDIATDPANPFQGVIINNGGANVYVDVPKDYVGEAVTPENFLRVLNGTADEKRVIPDPDNRVFVYFADHGAPGLVAFPNDELYAHDLIQTFQQMNLSRAYESIVVYMEACESGSMFNGLLDPSLRVYAVTAATPDEPSYACCMDDTVGAFTGDVFSVVWLQNADSFERVVNQTLSDEFAVVRGKTKTSHVCDYGDMTIRQRNLSEYLVWSSPVSLARRNKTRGWSTEVSSRDVKIDTLMRLYSKGHTKVMKELQRELYQRHVLETAYGDPTQGQPRGCHSKVVSSRCIQRHMDDFKRQHGHLTETSLKYVRSIASECFS